MLRTFKIRPIWSHCPQAMLKKGPKAFASPSLLPECQAERTTETLDPRRHDLPGQVVEDRSKADAVSQGAGHDASWRENSENLG